MTQRRVGSAPEVLVQAERVRMWEDGADEGPFLSMEAS